MLNQEPNAELELLRDEVSKLSRVMSEVMGEEFDTIMARQLENQQSTLRWFVQALAVSIGTLQLLVEKGLVSEEESRERIRQVQAKLLSTSAGLGASPDLNAVLDQTS